VEQIIEHVPPTGGAELAGASEDTCGMASGQSMWFDGPPLEDYLQTVITSVLDRVTAASKVLSIT
jgi:hypothetical protein